MMPLGDDNSEIKSVPAVTYALIALNVIVFFLELAGGEPFVIDWSFIPGRFKASPAANFPTVFTSMFMHAGGLHLFGNMLYLWIFGDNVEDRLGRIPFLLFYLFCGIIATFAQYAVDPNIAIPNLGASGAIAGVLGAYILFFPNRSVRVAFGAGVTEMPALFVIGFWFVLQFLSNLGSMASAEHEDGGVAYLAHIGGFIAGLAIATFIKLSDHKKVS